LPAPVQRHRQHAKPEKTEVGGTHGLPVNAEGSLLIEQAMRERERRIRRA
jgi:hypothetical protein